jgi:CheY-like chemotaxis protein
MPTILVIEDVPQIRLLLVHLLESAGYRVLEAEDGDSGIRRWREERPELVITDLVMPGKEGLDVIREIRLADRKARVVAMTGAVYRGNVNLLDEALRLGAAATFQKPFNVNEVLRLVKILLAEDA